MQVPADDASIAGGQEDESDGSRIVDGQSGAGNQAGGGSAGVSEDVGTNATGVSPLLLVADGTGQITFLCTHPEMQLHEFTLRVPFASPLEAEVAKIYLALFNEHPDFYRELTINGSLLTVRWIAQDPGHLYKVFDSFLKDLSLFFHTINFLGPRYPFPS
ncbi:EKC/KEOPS complex subunit Lage3 isoform X2 [Fukomys damarensis]|uniref:EKC/KEOPS complex subunit Lage3 isoform X2 n=1 Tax=Fukomys damarensis TaxID=885580 RepID=UPI00053FCB6C|nr:EKC/KEOPS complex subunit Lage3 isoform X2 [Fukomys damarensis]